MLGGKISNALENNSFAASFMHWKLRRDCNKDYRRWGKKAKQGLDYRIVNKNMYVLEASYSLYQRYVNLKAQNNGQDLL